MRKVLRVSALFAAIVVAALWFFGGANLGWTKDSVSHPEKDPVTGLEAQVIEKRWVPGVDFLAMGLAAAAALVGASFLAPRGAKDNERAPAGD
jgi:hypothetical protein